MNRITIKIIGIIFLISACASSKQSGDKVYEVINMVKTECKGACPTYTISIMSNGEMKLNGRANMDYIGDFTNTLSSSQLDELITNFTESNFFDFDESYEASITDRPTTYLTFTDDGKTHKVKDYYGAPDSLKALEDQVHNLLSLDGWKQ